MSKLIKVWEHPNIEITMKDINIKIKFSFLVSLLRIAKGFIKSVKISDLVLRSMR